MNDRDITPLAGTAVSAHELFQAFQQAGFTGAQALYLTAAVACGGPKSPG